MQMDDDDYYRNADPRDHRTGGGGRGPTMVGWTQPPTTVTTVQQPAPQPVQAYSPMTPPGYYGYPSMTPPGYFGSGYPMPGGGPPPGMAPWYPPGMFGGFPPGYPPGAFGYPPGFSPYWGAQSQQSNTGRTIGRVLRAATPLVVALLPLPAAPTPIASTGDTAKDLAASLTNEANQIAYQQALANTIKRDELVLALGEGAGILLEKGWS
jgi:hypothetical protein